tara:strand:+ start:5275 stop:5976 length:702 start_codon:yes stop_codon:yes gene_type:complete
MSEVKKVDEQTELITLWKKHNIGHVEFDFYCGGDSMGDTELRIYDKKGQSLTENFTFERKNGSWGEYEERIPTLIEDKIYADVEFYVNSDGHYQGESGMVEMTFNEEESMFDCSKSSESEWSERETNNILLDLTKEEFEFINNYVESLNGGEGDFVNFNYKKDFIVDDKRQKLIDDLTKKIDDITVNFEPDCINGELQDWFTFECGIDGNEVQFEDDKLVIEINNEITVFKEE